MRRALAILAAIVAAGATVAFVPLGSDDDYLVRAYFDNGSFIVHGEDVRVGGANVGAVESVEVSLPGETVSLEDGPRAIPGKAVVVLRIDDPGFQDFRADATCLIRPQSLIGERFVNCDPTRSRAPGSEPSPPLETVPEGEPGEGQRMLPLESNGTMVDVDLVTNINREPFIERFRLILNDLGATLASRGEDLADIVERANPALRETNRVLATLASQRRRLAQLASDSREIMEPLARERRHVSGFIVNAGVAAEATAERRPDLEEALGKFPGFLVELRETMGELEGFSEAGLPMARDLGIAAPSLTRATEALEPFADASTVALQSLGDAGEAAGPDLAAIEPVVRQTRELGRSGQRPTRNLSLFLRSTRRTGGLGHLMDLIYNFGASVNAFDEHGHFVRLALVPSNCLEYVTMTQHECESNFHRRGGGFGGFSGLSGAEQGERGGRRAIRERSGGLDELARRAAARRAAASPDADDAAPESAGEEEGEGPEASPRAVRDLLDFLVGEEER